MSSLRIPSATYRLQFNRHFTLAQAVKLVPYLHELGISDIYASPMTKARPGSLHGYDVLDHNQINPELGTEEDLGNLAASLKENGMGLLLDIVPNHMCVTAANKWWSDVLENGPSSLHSHYFNIIWNPPKAALTNKILLPVLDQQYGKVIENQELKVVYDAGAFFIECMAGRLPVNPRTWLQILEPVSKKLETEWSQGNGDVLELQSILTALVHLPSMTETDPEKCRERNREKEIIKKRLLALLDERPAILNAIQESLNSLNGIKGDPHSFDRLEELLESQAYRLSFWRVTNDEINYRRFFDINELASLRVENEEVFEAIHEFVLSLVKKGWVTGFRIDHVDGLFDPQQYLIRLQGRCKEVIDDKSPEEGGKYFYVIVEKVLEGDEQLYSQWQVFGTTGYDYLNFLNGVFVSNDAADRIRQIYEHFTSQRERMTEVIYAGKKLILFVSMSSELHILARHLEEISEQHRWSRDYTLESLRFALRDIIACFPVYRSYIRLEDKVIREEDRCYVKEAIQEAKRVNPAIDLSIFDFIESVLLLQDPEGITEEQINHRRHFVMRFQQLTGPVTAKGLEDTALYRRYPLASLNEVGMDPLNFGTPIEIFHQRNKERLEKWPHTLVATFTHDTKRSEDVRARINVISEAPDAWKEAIERWQKCNQDKKTHLDRQEVPDRNEEYLIYQTLVGTWPLYPMDASGRAHYTNRINAYMNKAIKEAKVHTSWINANEAYEKGVKDFIDQILSPDYSQVFLKDFANYVRPLARAGLFNSLAQILFKMTTPGVPDFYQGSELWEFTLVDPDNRRPVDYSYRMQLLNSIKEMAKKDQSSFATHLLEFLEDGRIKLYLTSQVLDFRRSHLKLFQEGDYEAMQAEGTRANHVIAFSRVKEDQSMIVVAGRFYTPMLDMTDSLPIGEEIWQDTSLVSSRLNGKYRDILSGLELDVLSNERLKLSTVFSHLPLALLHRIE